MSLRYWIIFLAAIVYWGGVFLNGYRIYRKTRSFPKLGPSSGKEKWLWLGWFLVISGWIGQPFLHDQAKSFIFLSTPNLFHDWVFLLGVCLMLFGYICTLWCYQVMGSAWAMVTKHDKLKLVQDGPYKVIRHPIYTFQWLIFLGVFLSLPTPYLLILLVLHAICIHFKATDEEGVLETSFGDEYQDYKKRVGKFFPKF